VTRGQLPQRAGSPGLNGGRAAAAVPQKKVTPSPTTFDIITELQSLDKTTKPAASSKNWTSH